MTVDFGDPRLPGRFWDKIEVVVDASTYPGPCWIWTRATAGAGYGVFASLKDSTISSRYCHRISFHRLISPVSPALEVDHLCRIILCCNPAHLELVTRRENVFRSDNFCGIQMRAESCIRGHEFSDANTRVSPQGQKRCRVCERGQRRAKMSDPEFRAAYNQRARELRRDKIEARQES